MIDEIELARRSILGFGEIVAALGRGGCGAEAEVRRPDALGARVPAAASNPWIDAAVVPLGRRPPEDDPLLPRCLWAAEGPAPGREEDPWIAMPCLGLALEDPGLVLDGGATDVGAPSLAEIGDINERAYGQFGVFGPLVRSLDDPRIRTHGLREGGAFACVALTLAVGDDLSIQYVATEAGHRRRGLASRLLLALLKDARARGMRSATLQASPAGLSVYERLGFRRVATLRAFLRPEPSPVST